MPRPKNKAINFSYNNPDEKLMDDIKDSLYISKLEQGLRDMSFRDIKKISTSDTVLASFILCSCFIEQLATFRYGCEVGKVEFTSFVKEYLMSYDPLKLREDLRNRLVHNYSLGSTYTLTSGEKAYHLKPFENTIIINLENFVDDLESALERFLTELNTEGSETRKNALKIVRKIEIISPTYLDVKN